MILRPIGADLDGLSECWTDRSVNLEPVEERVQGLKLKVVEQFARLSDQKLNTAIDYSALLETGKL